MDRHKIFNVRMLHYNQMNYKSVTICNYRYTKQSKQWGADFFGSWFFLLPVSWYQLFHHSPSFGWFFSTKYLYILVCVWLYITLPLSFPGFKGCISVNQQCFLNQPDCSFHSNIHLSALSRYSYIADDNVSLRYCRSVDIELKIAR